MAYEEASEELRVFAKEFGKESDRACVVLSAAMLEQALDSVFRTCLVAAPSSRDDLLDGPNAPLSSFSAKIDLAHRIGVISTKFCRDLHLIRKIRNQFAHNVTGCDFSNRSVCDQVGALIRSSGMAKREPETRKKLYSKGARGDFQMSVAWMLFQLRTLPAEIKRMEPRHDEFGYTYVLQVPKD